VWQTLRHFPGGFPFQTRFVQPYELFVGLRYTRAKRRNHFISFISMASMVGIAVGVMALIVVLSVMNGFQKELRARILESPRTFKSPASTDICKAGRASQSRRVGTRM
jgi:hypothetical protein